MDLTAKLLIAMPGMADPRFARAVVFMCFHDQDQGAMGLVINHPTNRLTFGDLLKQTRNKLPMPKSVPDLPIHVGGPVETGRGFVLHSPDYHLTDQTQRITDTFSMTATLDILADLANGNGPAQSILALGYSGWSAGQLESEIMQNAWLTTDPSTDLVFGTSDRAKWDAALATLGIDPRGLSARAGHA